MTIYLLGCIHWNHDWKYSFDHHLFTIISELPTGNQFSSNLLWNRSQGFTRVCRSKKLRLFKIRLWRTCEFKVQYFFWIFDCLSKLMSWMFTVINQVTIICTNIWIKKIAQFWFLTFLCLFVTEIVIQTITSVSVMYWRL